MCRARFSIPSARVGSHPQLALSACENPFIPLPSDFPGPRPGHVIHLPSPVRLGARVERRADELVVIAELYNPSFTEVTLSTGACPFRLRAYASDALVEPAFWDDRTTVPIVCPDGGGIIRQVPHGASEVTLGVVHREFLALGFPDRPGYFGVVVIHNDQLGMLRGGSFRP